MKAIKKKPKYSFLPDTMLLKQALSLIHKEYGLDAEDILQCVNKKEGLNGFPVGILKGELSCLEAIVTYCREEKNFSYKKIALLLQRNELSLPRSYACAKRKKKQSFSDEQKNTLLIPFSVFRKDLSILEAICVYLKKMNMTNTAIAKLINRNQKTVWTALDRAKRRLA